LGGLDPQVGDLPHVSYHFPLSPLPRTGYCQVSVGSHSSYGLSKVVGWSPSTSQKYVPSSIFIPNGVPRREDQNEEKAIVILLLLIPSVAIGILLGEAIAIFPLVQLTSLLETTLGANILLIILIIATVLASLFSFLLTDIIARSWSMHHLHLIF
jgi:hypothetical protein